MVSVVVCSAIVAVGLLGGCTKKNPEFCEQDSDCELPGRPFCDVAGDFPESDHTPHRCTTIPNDCPLERCGCTPGESLACDADQLTVCGEDGFSTATLTCGLGCSTEDRCLTFDPSNGLGPALVSAAAEPDLVLPAAVTIDTDLGTIVDSSNMPVAVRTLVVEQEGGSKVRAFLARSIVLNDAIVRGSASLAIVAPGTIAVRGRLDASATERQGGPGTQESPAACVGAESKEFMAGGVPAAVGAGGGGNATGGGKGGGWGGPSSNDGGAPTPGFVPLVGGCRGGVLLNQDRTTRSRGGGGGGAIQFVSLDTVAFSIAGFVDVGAGGGEASAGGGSGGTIVIEAPRVRFDGAATGIAANGGAGGGCDMIGVDATSTTAAAVAPKCGTYSAGDGGTGVMSAADGDYSCPQPPCPVSGTKGAGGGAAGRASIVTLDGTFEQIGNPVMSVAISASTLVVH